MPKELPPFPTNCVVDKIHLASWSDLSRHWFEHHNDQPMFLEYSDSIWIQVMRGWLSFDHEDGWIKIIEHDSFGDRIVLMIEKAEFQNLMGKLAEKFNPDNKLDLGSLFG